MVSNEELKKAQIVEARAKSIFPNVRCTECGSQSIEDSQADVAILLRKLIRDGIREGKTDKEVYKSLAERFGEDVLYAPHFDLQTAAIWLSPGSKKDLIDINPMELGYCYWGCNWWMGISEAQAKYQCPRNGSESCSRCSVNPNREGNYARTTNTTAISEKKVVELKALVCFLCSFTLS
ncbi:hypothetical protein ZIOFF_008933 [Zingiber officinale]|uniref:Cytochrome c-type biogenesis protein n=1 Tax=Zingiber officinale TaxID=94328 RepID=A0A8J5M6A7_ZINOF|nr:hypothetical protein ZIOFF_008933 [Zingiber officinale]